MKADLTRLTFRTDKHYRSVRMQQGRVQMDADWNEQQDILNHRIETETEDTLGYSAGPLKNPGFTLSSTGKNITIGAGQYYVEGLLCENPVLVTVTTQPDFPRNASPILPPGESLIPIPPAGSNNQPNIITYNAAGAAVNPPDGIYIAYLEVWQRHITALEDSLIREVALGGPDTATREKTLWQVKLLRAADLSTNLNCLSANTEWDTLIANPDGQLAARAEPSTPPKDPCLLAPEAGYRRLENQLYRVEIHDDGTLVKPRFKWSRNNGFLETKVVRWLNDPVADEFKVASIGRDAFLAITAGCWVEFFDETHELLGQPGTLVKVLKTAGNVVTVDLATKTGSLDKALFNDNPRVRVWENWADIVTGLPSSNTGWVELEDGVEIKFTPGKYRSGDFWMIPARTAKADIEWPKEGNKPKFLSPQGILRVFTRLALFSVSAGNWTFLSDCRSLFPALSELTNLYYVGGDGQEIIPDFVTPANNKLPSPLEVAVFNGEFPVTGAQVRFVASHGTFPNGTQTQIVSTAANGISSIDWTLSPNNLNQTVTAELLEAGQSAVGKYTKIHFSARLSTACQVAYNPGQCNDLKVLGVTNVQDAIDALCQRIRSNTGCCVTVGRDGEFPALDIAIKALSEKYSEICICLLPGNHHLTESINLQAQGLKLLIHGAGRGSQLILEGGKFNFMDLDALSLRDFDILNIGDPIRLRVQGTAEVQLHNMHISGMSRPGLSLVQISEAEDIQISSSRLNTFQKEVTDTFKQVLSAIDLLKPLSASFNLKNGDIFQPVSREVVAEFAKYDEHTRNALIKSIQAFIRQSAASSTISEESKQALLTLAETFVSEPNTRTLSANLNAVRATLILNRPGFALAIEDAQAKTLLADNQINGRFSIYGESSNIETSTEILNADFRKLLQAEIASGRIVLKPARGHLRVRNNVMREIRFGDEFLKVLLSIIKDGKGELRNCYANLIADANTLVGRDSQLIAIDLAFNGNVLQPFKDVGIVIATQAKYIGNFAHDDFRLFNVGNNPENFGNGRLNIV